MYWKYSAIRPAFSNDSNSLFRMQENFDDVEMAHDEIEQEF